jgi:hypothetical protein
VNDNIVHNETPETAMESDLKPSTLAPATRYINHSFLNNLLIELQIRPFHLIKTLLFLAMVGGIYWCAWELHRSNVEVILPIVH